MKALITGATSGFGYASALKLAELGYDVVLTGRRATRLAHAENEIKSRYAVDVRTLCFDIRDGQACKQAWNSLPPDWRQVDVLLNNAGLAACADPFDKADTEDFECMIDTNLKGLIYMSKLVVEEMKQRRNGLIINLSSIAGVEVYPNGNVYCATKHAVNAITKGMRMDLLPYGIKVSSISPGAAETEFSLVRYKGDEARAKAVYAGLEPLVAEDIADTVAFIVTRPAHVMIHDILLTPARQASSMLFNRN